MYAQGYQGADVLAALIAGVELNHNRKSGASETAEVLRRQLEHTQAAGPVATAPLALYDLDLTGAIAAAGGIGAAGSLSDLP